jgi:hypothetical protein
VRRVWSCKIGVLDVGENAATHVDDRLLRRAAEDAFLRTFLVEPDFAFSGCGTDLTELELAEVEGRDPDRGRQVNEALEALFLALGVNATSHVAADVRAVVGASLLIGASVEWSDDDD